MPEPSRAFSSLYYRLLTARRSIPFVTSLAVIVFERTEHGIRFSQFQPLGVVELLIFAAIGPGLTFLALTWLLARVAERDLAESQLALATAQQQQLLATFERIVRTERLGFVPMLEQMLAAICEGDSVSAGAVYLLPAVHGTHLTPAARWPAAEAKSLLDEAARGIPKSELVALAEGGGLREVHPAGDGTSVVVMPITGAGEPVGLLVLARPPSVKLPESNILSIVTSMMALTIRNGQLYARLQSQAVLEERNELAREVHDTLAQTVGFLNLKAQHAQRLLDRGLLGEASGVLDELSSGSRQAYDEVRQIIRDLRWPVEVSGGLAHSLQEYLAVTAARTGLEIAVDVEAEPQLSPDAQLQLFRVVQEAVTNIYRHARACHVLIRLAGGPEGVCLSVEDDGNGLPSAGGPNAGQPVVSPQLASGPMRSGPIASDRIASGEHLGLRIMTERVQSIGGKLQLESPPGRGTVLTVRVPASAALALSEEDRWAASVF